MITQRLSVALLAFIYIVSVDVHAKLYNCTDKSGRQHFQDRPCNKDQYERSLELEQPKKVSPKLNSKVPAAKGNLLVAPPASVPDGSKYAIHTGEINTPEWVRVMDQIREMPSITAGNGRLTVLRVFIEDPTADDRLQAEATRLVAPMVRNLYAMSQQGAKSEILLPEIIGFCSTNLIR